MILLPSPRQRIASVPFLLRAHDCLDETGLFALSYGRKIYATFTRTGRGLLVDQAGHYRAVPEHMPRVSRWLLAGTRVPVLLTEGVVANLALYSEEYNQWSDGGATVTTNATSAPDGTLTMDLVQGVSSASDSRYRAVTFTANGTKCFGVVVGEYSSSATFAFALYDVTATTFRHRVQGAWVNGVPVLSTADGAGTRFEVIPLKYGRFLCLATATGVVAANQNNLYCYPDLSGGNGGTFFWGALALNDVVPGSYVRTAGASDSQLAEAMSFTLPMKPAPLSALYAGVESGIRAQCQVSADSFHLWTLTDAAAANPKLRMNCFSGTGRYQFQRTLASGTQLTAGAASDAAQPDYGEGFKLLGRLYADGHVDAAIRKASAGTETSGVDATTAALETAWGGSLLYLNQQGSAGNQRFRSATRALCLAPGAKAMDELSDLCELD